MEGLEGPLAGAYTIMISRTGRLLSSDDQLTALAIDHSVNNFMVVGTIPVHDSDDCNSISYRHHPIRAVEKKQGGQILGT